MKKQIVTLTIILGILPIIINAQHIGTGSSLHTIVVNSDGTVYTWGLGVALGIETSTNSNVPVTVNTDGVLSGKIITQVAAGNNHSIALASDGSVYTWGWNFYGQLGNGNTGTDSNVPVAVITDGVLSGKTITQVSAGAYHSIILASDGTVYTWGYNNDGELGNGTNTDSNVPVAVSTSGTPMAGKTIIKVAAGEYHSIALASDGTVYSWGRNNYGQLGNGTTTNSNVPVAVSTIGTPMNGKTITQVAAGLYHSIALASNGTVYNWGYNGDGQLGNGNNDNSNIPVAVSTGGVLSGKTIIKVAAGTSHSIALASDGTVYTYGYNFEGELGNGTNANSNVPVAVSTNGTSMDGKTITQVAAGAYHSIILASDGTVYTWGYNWNGQLGNGNNTDSNIPVEVDQSFMGLLPVEDNFADQIPKKFELSQNYPNPFNPTTSIRYAVSSMQFVSLKVFDVLGQEVATLVNEVKPAGEYEVEFNGKRLSSGMYFYELRAGNFVQVNKMILMK